MKDALGYSLYDLELARDGTGRLTRVTLYKFRDFSKPWYDKLTASENAAYRKQSEVASLQVNGSSGDALNALTTIIGVALLREKVTRVVLSYAGHGGPTSFYEGMLSMPDAHKLVRSVKQMGSGVPLILDFSTQCHQGYFDFAVNFFEDADYLLASEQNFGGFAPDSYAEYLRYDHFWNYDKFWQPSNSLAQAFDSIVVARQGSWAVAKAGLLRSESPQQSLAVYSLSKFSAFLNSLARDTRFVPDNLPRYSNDIGTYVYAINDPALIAKFEAFRFRYVSDRNIIQWSNDTRGFSVALISSLKTFLAGLLSP